MQLDLQGPVARITLASPQTGNALDLAMATALQRAAEQVAELAHVTVVRLDAQGRAFCVGGDLREFADVADPVEHVGQVAAAVHVALRTLRALAAPVVTVVQGVAAGGGLGLALAGDVVLAGAGVRLRSAYTAAGLSPDCGVTSELARALGPARALDLVLTNRTLRADEAERWGLVSRVVEDEQLAAVATELVDALAAGASGALAATKQLVRSAVSQPYAEQLDAEAASIARLAGTPDGREGVAAFLQKRSPVFASYSS